MSFQDQLAAALAGELPVVVVGKALDAVYQVGLDLGFRLAKLDAHACDDVAAHATWERDSKAPWLVVVENCHHVPATTSALADGRGPDDALFDLAFDGDPALPANTTLVLLFDEPTEVSEHLADIAEPAMVPGQCAFVALDPEPVERVVRIAA